MLVRLIPVEFEQLRVKSVGDIFSHTNLQHNGVPIELTVPSARYQTAVKIVKHGKEFSGQQVPPQLDLSRKILLEQLEVIHSLEVSKAGLIGEYEPKNLLLANPSGLIESFYDRYHPSLNISREDILRSKYFVRVFKVVDLSVE